MSEWLPHALAYADSWLSHQMRVSEQPGCSAAIMHGGDLVLERAYGFADLAEKTLLTPRHRFRVASHSKTFTAAGIMLLKEAGHLRLDDLAGTYIRDLPASLAEVTIGNLLSHSSGLVRDGADCGHWNDARPWPDLSALLHEVSVPLVTPPGERLKYSNLGYGLLGLVIGSLTGESFEAWVGREVVGKAGLTETAPDFSAEDAGPLAAGHSGKHPAGRLPIVGRNLTRALAPATGFVSTAADLARFFGQLDPAAANSVLSASSRREMTRRQWRSLHSASEAYYGLGIASEPLEGQDTFGHTGGFYGYASRTIVAPELRLTVSVLVNAVDGPASDWAAGVLHILRRYAKAGPPTALAAGWEGRWWNPWGALDLVPLGNRVLLASPDSLTPLADVCEITASTKEKATITVADGFGSFGEQVSLVFGKGGMPVRLSLAGEEYLPETLSVAHAKRMI